MTKHQAINPLSPPAIRRVSEAVAASVLQPQYGTPIGLLYLSGEIGNREYRATMAFKEAWEALEALKGVQSVTSPRYGEGPPERPRMAEASLGEVERATREFTSLEMTARSVGVESYHHFWRTVVMDERCPGGFLWCVKRCAAALAEHGALGSRHRRARRA